MSARLPARTWLYFIAQSVNLTTAVMAVTIAALVGAVVAPQPWMATLPYGGQFLVVMLATLPVARLMRRHGRKRIFLAATLPLALAGITGYLAVQDRSFWLLIVSHALHSPKDVYRTEGAYPTGFSGSAHPSCSSSRPFRNRWSKTHLGTQPMAREVLRDLTGPAISTTGRSPPHDRAAAGAGPGTTRQNVRTAEGFPTLHQRRFRSHGSLVDATFPGVLLV
mgnify:CR=1 FL=1